MFGKGFVGSAPHEYIVLCNKISSRLIKILSGRKLRADISLHLKLARAQ